MRRSGATPFGEGRLSQFLGIGPFSWIDSFTIDRGIVGFNEHEGRGTASPGFPTATYGGSRMEEKGDGAISDR